MVDLDQGMIIRGEKRTRIIKFVVWFITPFGFCETIHDAKEKMQSVDMAMSLTVRAVPIAIGEGEDIWEPMLS